MVGRRGELMSAACDDLSRIEEVVRIQRLFDSPHGVERHRPMLGLHGHLHESRGTYKLGPTVGINPGSEYNEGVLRGALIEIKKGKLKSHQFTTG